MQLLQIIEGIQEYVKSEYNLDSVFIPYGADHTTKEPLSNKLKVEFPFLNFKYAFTVCRIEPENNIHIILEAFRNFNSLNLVIVGNWSHSDYSRALREDYSAYSNIFLIDPIYEQKKLNAIRSNCYIYLHGHSAGGTNPSLVEAMYLKLPIISFDINYNRETTKNRALYFYNENDLVKTIKSVSKDDLKKVAIDMFNIAIREYTWDKVSNRYSKVMSGLYGLAQIEDKNCSIQEECRLGNYSPNLYLALRYIYLPISFISIVSLLSVIRIKSLYVFVVVYVLSSRLFTPKVTSNPFIKTLFGGS